MSDEQHGGEAPAADPSAPPPPAGTPIPPPPPQPDRRPGATPPPPPPPSLAATPAANDTPPNGAERELIFKSDLAEVYLLLDFITGRPDRNLDDISMKDPANQNEEWKSGQIVQKLMEIQYPPKGPQAEIAKQAAVLLVAKDQLSRVAAPARGATIAYTAMYVDREGRSWWSSIFRRGRGESSKPRKGKTQETAAADDGRSLIRLATEAFPHFERHGGRFRFLRRLLLWGGLLVVLMTAQTSWDVGHGRIVLARIDQAQKDWDTLLQANSALGNPNICQRYQPGQSQTAGTQGPSPAATTTVDPNWVACARLGNIQTDKEQAYSDLDQIFRCQGASCNPYLHVLHWGLLLCSGSEPPEVSSTNPTASTDSPAAPTSGASINTASAADTSSSTSPGPGNAAASANTAQNRSPTTHIHWQSANSVLTVFTSYVLPLLYGLLGTIIGAFRAIQTKIRNSVLAPRDFGLTIVGVFLGIAAGLVIGILFSPGSVPARGSGNALGNVTLTPAALAFLAGYASQSFFRFIDDVIAKIFPSDVAVSPPPPPAAGAR